MHRRAVSSGEQNLVGENKGKISFLGEGLGFERTILRTRFCGGERVFGVQMAPVCRQEVVALEMHEGGFVETVETVDLEVVLQLSRSVGVVHRPHGVITSQNRDGQVLHS